MQWKWLMIIWMLVNLMLGSACNRYQVIPNHLRDQVNRNVAFDDLKGSETNYRGELIVLGGEVLSAKRLADKTSIEVLQLPLGDDLTPTAERTRSQGRFIALDDGNNIVDPAVLKEGTPVTIIGEVQSPSLGSLDESVYWYPTVVIRDMTVWDVESRMVNPYPSPLYYYGYGYRPYSFMSGSRVVY